MHDMEYSTRRSDCFTIVFDTLGARQHLSPIHFHCKAKSNANVPPNISQKKGRKNDKRVNDDRTISSNRKEHRS